ncbi:MAG: HAMP domain-containing histidine kinase [Tissierellales bacterium]|jgi:signal transduction histidine kinase|nr:HAMP domain-containing histidine kinase [Tissierellales bacterium]
MLNIRGIGKKILFSYLMLLIFVLVFTNGVFWILSETYLTNKTREKLMEEGYHVAKVYKETNYKKDVLGNRFVNRRNFTIAGKFIDSNILLLNENHEIIYTDMDEAMINYFIGNDSEEEFEIEGYETAHVSITDESDESLRGHVFLITKREDIEELVNLNRESLTISIMFSMIFAIILGVLFEKSITRPIKLLQKKMTKFVPGKPQKMEAIRTGDEIEKLDKCFSKMTSKIVEMDRAKTTIFQNTSHELKTPLMSIRGYAEAIKDGIAEGDTVNECLDIIIKESMRLTTTLDDLIYLSKVDELYEFYDKKMTYLSDSIYSSIKSVKSIADDAGIEIIFNRKADHFGNYDEDKMIRAFINILGNCVRYANSYIEITLDKGREGVFVKIIDDGTGFKLGEEHKIFERYYKGNNGNTGLGLSIVNSIIRGHNGTITAHNRRETQGAMFEIHLPRV